MNENEDGFLGGYGETLADYIHELPHSQVHRDQILALVDSRDVAPGILFADYWNSVGVPGGGAGRG